MNPLPPMEDIAEKVLCQHYIVAYGDCSQQLKDLYALLGVEVN